MKKAAIALTITAVLLTACGPGGMKHSGTMDHSGSMNDSDHGNMDGMTMVADKTQAENIKAKFMLSNDQPQPNQSATITVRIQDKDGNPVNDFDVQHEKLMHMIIVRKDLSYFNHIHPDYKGNGEFTITTQFPTAGEYEIISDIAPTGIGAMSKSEWITVQGTAPAVQPINPDPTLTKEVDGKEVTLSINHLMANMELELNFNIKDAQTKQPITDLQPFLGAVGHVVILNDKGGEYLHVHPAEENSSGPDAKFMATFPHSGVYKIWGQFQQNGKVFTVDFVIEVP
ncbi:FixH family protein [Paenibacillus sp. MMO-177]|uniref:FixH family protein n=1 Tax=Paenibacillus sp. MMO-177 TaxID=3081289 RepID=UPI00301854FA